MNTKLSLSLKGNRNYLRGSDFYQVLSDWAVSEYGDDAYLSRLSFRRLTRNCCMVSLEKPSVDQPVGEGEVTSPRGRSKFWLIETEKLVTERRAFDEICITDGMVLRETECIAELAQINGSAIDEVICLTKQLNYAISPGVDGSWLFGQLQLEMPLHRAERPLRIVMRSLLANRFSVNDIYYGDQQVGNIRFIVGKP